MFRKVLLSAALVAGFACLFAPGEARANDHYYQAGHYAVGYQGGGYYGGTYYRPMGYQPGYYGPAYYPPRRVDYDDDTPYPGAPVYVKRDKNFYRSQWDPRYQPRWKFDDGRWEVEYDK